MILELTGLPGSGKTTSEPCIAEALRKKGFDIISRDGLVRRYVRDYICSRYSVEYRLRRPCTLLYRSHVWKNYFCDCWTTASLSSAVWKGPRLRGYWLSEDIKLSQYYIGSCEDSELAGSIYLPSEGLVHHYAALLAWAGTGCRSFIHRWTRRYSSKGIVTVVLELPFDEAFERFWSRGVPPYWPTKAKASKGAAQETFRRYQEAIRCSTETFQAAGARICSLDVSGDIAAMEDRVWTLVSDIV